MNKNNEIPYVRLSPLPFKMIITHYSDYTLTSTLLTCLQGFPESCFHWDISIARLVLLSILGVFSVDNTTPQSQACFSSPATTFDHVFIALMYNAPPPQTASN